MKSISVAKKFHSLTAQKIQAALNDKNVNPIKKEFYRLVDYYESLFDEGDEQYAHAIETLLHVKKRPLIEKIAIEFAAGLRDTIQSTIPEAKRSPDLLRQIGKVVFGKQWQTPLANTLKVADRTVRRWDEEGAPLRIGRKLFTILTDHQKAIRHAHDLLSEVLKRPNLHLVKS